MTPLRDAPADYPATRTELRRIATHVCAKARHQATGRFGLRPAPGGFGTPAYGTDNEVVRVSGAHVVVDRAGDGGSSSRSARMNGAGLGDLAVFAGVALDPAFSVGSDTAALGDPAAPLAIDEDAVLLAGEWLAFGMRVMDDTLAALGPTAGATCFQLWPEHFDLGADVLAGQGRVNLGAALGDDFHPLPYLYAAPWDDRRPGGPTTWNAPFGAMLVYEELAAAGDPAGAARTWLDERIGLLQRAG